MNLLITTDCNLACPYCFAGSLRKERPTQEMTLPELDTVLSVMTPEKDSVRLMGGEPTLHSKYLEILQLLKGRGFTVVVFTNGTQDILHRTMPTLPDRVLLNLNDRSFYSRSQRRKIIANMDVLGNRIELAYTITDPDFDLGWHQHLILEKGLQPVIRLGLAQPVIGGDNVYLQDEDLPAVHASVLLWAKRLSEHGIRLSMDCGFMRSQFSDSDIDELIRAGTVLRFECSPAIDIGPGLQTWRCYAFSNQREVNWLDFNDENACLAWFTERDKDFQQGCSPCQHLESGLCQGGCLARALRQNLITGNNWMMLL